METQDTIDIVVKKQKLQKRSSQRSNDTNNYEQIQKFQKNKKDYFMVLLFIGISNKFKCRQLIRRNEISKHQLQKQYKRPNKATTVKIINPISKQVKNLNITSQFFKQINKECLKYLNISHKRESRYQNKKSSLFESEMILRSNIQQPKNQSLLKNVSRKNIEKNDLCQNQKFIGFCSNKPKKLHKRTNSDNLKQNKTSNSIRFQREITSLTRQTSFVKRSLMSSTIKSNYFNASRCKQKNSCIKTISNCYNHTEYSPKSIFTLIQIFLQGIHKANYMLNIVKSKECLKKSNLQLQSISMMDKQNTAKTCYKSDYQSQLSQIVKRYHKILQICDEINSKKVQQDVFIKRNKKMLMTQYCNTKFKEYFDLVDQLTATLRSLLNSIYFQKLIQMHKNSVKKLVPLIYDTRYSLKYLQKQIQNLHFCKKAETYQSKWQKVFKAKFLPKRILC